MRIGSLFAGIGGLELGLEWSGIGRTVWQVERDPYRRAILARHWPHVERFENVESVGAGVLQPVDLICGGFPCQDLSGQGKSAGIAGSRSGLWRQFARVADEMRPAWIVVENVYGGARSWVDAVVLDLVQLGYAPLPVPVTAVGVGAPHLRPRIFVVAYAAGERREKRKHGARRDAAPATPRPGGQWNAWTAGPPVAGTCGMGDGFPHRLDRIAALGDAVVPQCAQVIGEIIRDLDGALATAPATATV